MRLRKLLTCVVIGAVGAEGRCGEIAQVTGAVEVIDPPASVVPPSPEGREEKILIFREGAFTVGAGQTLQGFMPGGDVIDASNDIVVVEIGPGELLQGYSIACTRPEAGSARVEGSVTFSQPIVMCDWGGGSYEFAIPGTAYPETYVVHLDFPFGFAHEPAGIGDILKFSEDRRTITFSLNGWGENPADQLRIVTLADEIDENACWEMLHDLEITGEIRAAARYGGELYIAGFFDRVDGVSAANIARWDGDAWRAVGGGINGGVSALAVYDDGSGPALYAGGSFGGAGQAPALRIARWDGASWSALAGSNPNLAVNALAVHDDGEGEKLYVGGQFTHVGGMSAPYIACWDGSAWSPLAGCVNRQVRALASYADGEGDSRLYVGGDFVLVDGAQVIGIAAWDGAAWSAPGGGMAGGSVLTLGVFDGGAGSELIASGGFQFSQGGVAMRRIGAWDGEAWRALGDGIDGAARAMLSSTDSDGAPALYVGGDFYNAGGIAARHIASWDGAAWEPLAGGSEFPVRAIVEGQADGLPIVGASAGTGLEAESIVMRWRGCDDGCTGDLTGNLLVDFADLMVVLSSYGSSGAEALGDVNGDGVVGLMDLQLVLHSFGPCPLGCPDGAGTGPDCNQNGRPDDCDIALGTSFDCDGNGVPDECDVASGLGTDCNNNGKLDACEIAGGQAEDCNGNGIIDSCDVAMNPGMDCNQNGVPDSCDIASGTSMDCNGNGRPDECGEPDCDGDGVLDSCEIAAGAPDADGNGVPDACESVGCLGDITGDGLRDNSDLNILLAVYGQESAAYPSADINHDHRIDFEDLQILLHFFGEPCAGG